VIYEDGSQSPAGEVFDEAIELRIEERSPYPERSAFIDAGTPDTEKQMRQAAERGSSVVLVSPDRSVRVIAPGEILGRGDGGLPLAGSGDLPASA
jgi:hypothetical protein